MACGVAAVLAMLGARTARAERPHYGAGVSGAVAEIAGGSGERDGALAIGATGSWRPLRHLAAVGGYTYVPVTHAYTAVGFHTGYHRLRLLPEGRLPLGESFDFCLAAGPELVWLRSELRGVGGGGSRDRLELAFTTVIAVLYRLRPFELRASTEAARRPGAFDLLFGAAILYTWR